MIFLGAGASACFDIPTSPGLTREIENIIDENGPLLINDIRKFLERNNKDFDYENIITILTALTSPDEVNIDHYSHSFAGTYPDHKRDYTDVIDKMYEIVCNCCIAPFDQRENKYLKPEKLESIFKITYDPLIGVPMSRAREGPQLIFSTNYDPSVELWCQKRFLKCIDGTSDTNNPEIKQVLNSERSLKEIREKARAKKQFEVPLIRLHGSVWSYELQQKWQNSTHQETVFSFLIYTKTCLDRSQYLSFRVRRKD